jgi:trans-aconitate methyltransferase
MTKPLRHQYSEHGVRGYYEQFGAHYRNPHEAQIADALKMALLRWALDTQDVFDLACGSGEVTLALQALGVTRITGADPYTAAAYQARTGQTALTTSFEDIAAGKLTRSFSLIVCCFALHLLDESRLPLVAYQLAQLAPQMLILTPHKRPHLKSTWGWWLEDEFSAARVRVRYYRLKSGY